MTISKARYVYKCDGQSLYTYCTDFIQIDVPQFTRRPPMPAKAILTLRGKAKDVFAIIRRMAHQTTLRVVCGWCGLDMGQKDGKGQSGVTTGICDQCVEKMEKEKRT